MRGARLGECPGQLFVTGVFLTPHGSNCPQLYVTVGCTGDLESCPSIWEAAVSFSAL